MPEVKCDHCGRVHRRSSGIIEKSSKHFCSRECHREYKSIHGYKQKPKTTYHYRKLLQYAKIRRRMRRSEQ